MECHDRLPERDLAHAFFLDVLGAHGFAGQVPWFGIGHGMVADPAHRHDNGFLRGFRYIVSPGNRLICPLCDDRPDALELFLPVHLYGLLYISSSRGLYSTASSTHGDISNSSYARQYISSAHRIVFGHRTFDLGNGFSWHPSTFEPCPIPAAHHDYGLVHILLARYIKCLFS